MRFGQVEHRTILARLLASFVLCAPLAAEPAPALEAGYRLLYNLQFGQAHQVFRQWQQEHPADPLGAVSEAAAYLFSELDRMHLLESEFFVVDRKFLGDRPRADARVKRSFDAALARGAQLAQQALARDPSHPDALFASLLRHGLRADYLGLVDRSPLAALRETVQGRTVAEKLLKLRPDYHDAHLAIGVESYLLSLKPVALRWILRVGGARTDKETGLQKLRLTAEKGRYLMPFARLLLAVAALRDRDHATARKHLAWLAAEFPANHLYREELARLP